MKTVILDDHLILAEGLAKLIQEGADIVGVFNDPDQLAQFIQENTVDLLITDYSMPKMNGVDVFLRLRKQVPNLKGVLLSMHDDIGLVKLALDKGMSGFILKSTSGPELLQALTKIKAGHTYVSAELTARLLHQTDKPLFTDREMQVLQLIVKEYSNKQIAAQLFISERTVETYRKNLFQKANTNNVVGLIKFAYANKLIS